MENLTPDFQETLKRMLESPPKENKPLNKEAKNEPRKHGAKKDCAKLRVERPENWVGLYAAQQALSWAASPEEYQSPAEFIMGTEAISIDCLPSSCPEVLSGSVSQPTMCG
jgi:hypothetical protein